MKSLSQLMMRLTILNTSTLAMAQSTPDASTETGRPVWAILDSSQMSPNEAWLIF